MANRSRKPWRFDTRLDDTDKAKLDRLAARLGKSYAQVFREALTALDVLTSSGTAIEPVERRDVPREDGETRRTYQPAHSKAVPDPSEGRTRDEHGF